MKTQRNVLVIALMISLFAHLLYGFEGAAQVQAYEYTIQRQAAQLRDRDLQIELQQLCIEMQDSIIDEYTIIEPEAIPEYIGEFEISYYTAGQESTGKYPGHPEYGITRSGTIVEEGRTIAADWSILAPGSRVYIEGVGERIVEDTGGLIVGNCIDVFVEDVETALRGGRHKADVWIVEDE